MGKGVRRFLDFLPLSKMAEVTNKSIQLRNSQRYCTGPCFAIFPFILFEQQLC